MINITVDKFNCCIKIENEVVFRYADDLIFENIIKMLDKILDKAFYSGETICLEVFELDESYTVIDRWKMGRVPG